MHITFTSAAAEKLSACLRDANGTNLQLKLLHDTEGCGCVVSGVPALELISEPGPDDRLAQGDPFDFWYEPRHEIYYEPKLKVGYNPADGSFSLSSDGQIYSMNVKLIRPPRTHT